MIIEQFYSSENKIGHLFMNDKLLLAKSITLLYRQSQLKTKVENSSDIVRTVLESIKTSESTPGISLNSERDIIIKMKKFILEMCDNPSDHEYDLPNLIQTIKHACVGDDRYCELVIDDIKTEIPENQIKRNIVNLQKSLTNHFKEVKIGEVLSKAGMDFRFRRESIKDINHFLRETISQLETLEITSSAKDPAMIGEVDISSSEHVQKVFNDVKSINNGTKLYKTGWHDLNRMLQGGFRPGEFWMFAALQHKYKTGLNLTIFKQIPIYNKPLTEDLNKKPLLLRISFEDDLTNNLQFLYQNIRYNETKEYVDVRNVTVENMTDCVTSTLRINGFHIKMLRMDPTLCTYRSVLNKITEYESQGYNVEVLCLDYLSKIPTVGCISGSTGDDYQDMFGRVRGFCSAKGIVVLTPHQLSTEAKALLRGGMPEDEFVKQIAGKGYFEKSKALDRIYDGCIISHLFKHQKESWLSLMLDKHRLPTVLENEDWKYMLLKFPKGMPIPDDLYESESISFNKLPKFINTGNAAESLFSF
jgi:hypothetical protein